MSWDRYFSYFRSIIQFFPFDWWESWPIHHSLFRYFHGRTLIRFQFIGRIGFALGCFTFGHFYKFTSRLDFITTFHFVSLFQTASDTTCTSIRRFFPKERTWQTKINMKKKERRCIHSGGADYIHSPSIVAPRFDVRPLFIFRLVRIRTMRLYKLSLGRQYFWIHFWQSAQLKRIFVVIHQYKEATTFYNHHDICSGFGFHFCGWKSCSWEWFS